MVSVDSLSTEYSENFDRLRKNRVEMSFYKYGSASDNFGAGRVDAIKTAELCISVGTVGTPINMER